MRIETKASHCTTLPPLNKVRQTVATRTEEKATCACFCEDHPLSAMRCIVSAQQHPTDFDLYETKIQVTKMCLQDGDNVLYIYADW